MKQRRKPVGLDECSIGYSIVYKAKTSKKTPLKDAPEESTIPESWIPQGLGFSGYSQAISAQLSVTCCYLCKN